MAQTSYPFDGVVVSETQYSNYFRELQDSGVVGSSDGTALKVTSAGTSMVLSVAIGQAVVRGHFYDNDAVASVTIAAADTTARTDLVVLKLDPAANSIVLSVTKGTAGGAVPTPNQTTTGIYELPLAQIAVGASVTSISAASVTDTRRWVGNRVRSWTTTTRPANAAAGARVGMLGYNTTTKVWEFWNGTAWTGLVQAMDWSSIANVPGTFPPAAHTHVWADTTDKPTTFPPSTHTHDWSQIVNEPTTFPPSTHSHSWSSITSKPTTFTPSSHTHSYLQSDDTIAWANGSKKPYSNTATDGTWYSVWVEGSGTFCRNTSARKFKENIESFEIDPDLVLKMRPVIYDRKAKLDEETGEMKPGRKGEVGLIADEVDELGLKWMVQYMDGEIDALRYDLLGVALIPVVQRQEQKITDLEARLAKLEKLVEDRG